MRTLLSGEFDAPPVFCDAAGLPMLTPRLLKPLSPPLPHPRAHLAPVSPAPPPALLRLQADVVFLCSGAWRVVLVLGATPQGSTSIDHIDWVELQGVTLAPGSATVLLECARSF